MQTPWNQHNQTLQTWIRQELHALVSEVLDTSASGRTYTSVSFVHQLFLSTVISCPELWSLRREYYTQAAVAMVEIWRHFQTQSTTCRIGFACAADQTAEWIESVEAYCSENPWKSDLARLKLLMGLGEVEIAEILNIPERSVRRQIEGLPPGLMHAESSVVN